MKKILSLSLLCLMLILSSGISYAEGQVTEADLDSQLVSAGYPIELIERLGDDQKIVMIQEQLTYVTHKFNTDTITDEPRGDVSARQLTNFTSDIIVSAKPNNSNGTKLYNIRYSWTWNHSPLNTFTDKFGMAWTDDWDAIPSTVKSSVTHRGQICSGPNQTGCRTATYVVASPNGTYDKYTPGVGIGWKYDVLGSFQAYDPLINMNNSFNTIGQSGWGSVDITRASNKDGSTDSSSAVGNYFHKYVGVTSAGLSFSNEPSISIEWAFNHNKSDDEGEQWYWIHN